MTTATSTSNILVRNPEVKRDDVVQVTLPGPAFAQYWEDFASINNQSDALEAIGLVNQPGNNRLYRIIRRGPDARIVLTQS